LTALVGMVWFGESAGMLRLAGLAMIVGGVVVLNLSGR
jgi:small multidrug resistance pump